MTTIHMTCAWCSEHVEATPADVTLTCRNCLSETGVYRWWHCGQLITKPANRRVFAVLVAAGCEVEFTDESEMMAFRYELDGVRTPADMGFVS